jgi:hypothetical protein
MELFLNLLWVAIAVVAFGFWRTRWLRERPENSRDPLREWTAFACALVLLFFAVSLTDDLHSELVIFDECAGSPRHPLIVSGYHDLGLHRTFTNFSSPAEQPIISSLDPGESFDSFVLAEEFSPSFVDLCIRTGRSPPHVSL